MKQRKPRRKLLILLLLVLGCVAVLATGTYAAYTSSAWVKRVAVASTQSSEETRFSSNLLDRYPNGTNKEEFAIRPISVSSTGKVVIGITVCNYPHNKPTLVNQSQIGYTIKAMASPTGLEGCDVTLNSKAPTEDGIYTLKGGIKSENLHTLTVTPGENTDFSAGYIQVVVTPTDPTASEVGNTILAARLKLVPSAAGASTWNGEIKLDGNYANNDAINYHIYGTEQCVMILKWNPTVVELGKWSKELFGVTETENTGSLELSLGGPNQPTSYLLQFYRLKPAGNSADELGINFYPKVTSAS